MGCWKLLGLEGELDEAGKGYKPSPFSLMLAVDSKTDYKVVDFEKTYSGPKKVLVVCTEERYMLMENGKYFSSGNHPVETGQPVMHLVNAGFAFDVATPTGQPACIEEWALPVKDDVFMKFYKEAMTPKFEQPLSLKELVTNQKTLENYVLVFLPGGQGAMLGLPEDTSLAKLILHIKTADKYLMSVRHGPASFLSVKDEPHPYAGYELACFPDAVDKQTPMIGYLPGVQTWYYGEKLIERGMKIVNKNPDATFCVDRKLLTGASPKACQEMGVVAAQTLLKDYA